MIPDIEKVASDYLREHPAVAALNTRIVGKTPTQDTGGVSTSWVRVTRLDARDLTPGDAADHLIGFLLQLDCYAGAMGGQPEANALARTVRAALVSMRGGVHDGAAVSLVRVVGDFRRPDTDLSPERDRVVLTVEIRAHG